MTPNVVHFDKKRCAINWSTFSCIQVNKRCLSTANFYLIALIEFCNKVLVYL